MASMYRVRAIWSGFVGSPGYTNLYFGTTDPLLAGASLAAADTRSFFADLTSLFPDDVQINVDGTVAIVEDSTGVVETELSATIPAAVNGTATTGYAAPVGASIQWRTADFVSGRRVKGRTYIVPTLSTAFETDGTIASAALTTLSSAASGLIAASSQFVVWHRPTQPGVSADGSLHLVTSATVTDKAAVLRSRRD